MLNENQLNDIRHFCHSKGVIYYDLEQEIVDHLASVIEEEQVEFPEKSFEKILNEKANEFSPDWKTIETEKRNTLRRGYLREFGKEFMSYFTVPKILVTIAAVLVVVFFETKLKTENMLGAGQGLINLFNVFMILNFRSKQLLYKNMKENRIEELLVWNINKRLKLIFSFCFVLYIFTVLLTAIFENNLSFFKEIIYIYPLFVIIVFSAESTFYKLLQKMQNNYPLAFQN